MKNALSFPCKKTLPLSKRNNAKTVAILALCFPPVLLANPSGAQIMSGQVSVDNSVAGITKITNSPGAVIEWQDFSIKKGERTQFIQENAKSSVLNKVVGGSPSNILGNLLSNGKIFLINPNGVLFGKDASVDTQGLMVSTLSLNSDAQGKGNLQFLASSQAGFIHNEGLIHVSGDGSILLIAPTIENTGAISTKGGSVTLAAGQTFTLTSLDNPDIQFQLQTPDNQVLNLGDIRTQGGAVDIFANSITHSGTLNADSVSVDKQGTIRLIAKEDVTLGQNSLITASTPSSTASTLQVKANNAIVLAPAAHIESTNGKLNIILNADADAKEGGNIDINANATLNSNGGNIILGGGDCDSTGCDSAAKGIGTSPTQSSGIALKNATLTSHDGDIKIYGEGYTSQTAVLSDVHGVFIDQSTLSSGEGAMTLSGVGGVGKSDYNNNGVFLTGGEKSTELSSTSGHITIIGKSLATSGSDDFGVSADNTSLHTTGGSITLNGAGANGNAGVLLESNSHLGDANTGDIAVIASNNTEKSSSFVISNTLPSGDQPTVQTQGTLSIRATGNVTQLAPVFAHELILSGPANYTFNSAENTISTLVASTIGNLRFVNSEALTLGNAEQGINATGTLSINTNTGNITVANTLATSNASQNALKLNAGLLESDTLNSNILIKNNAKISVGTGGVGQLLTGAIAQSTGVFEAVGTDHSRYGSDETRTRYSAPLSEGLYAIYREQPTLTVSALPLSLTSPSVPFSGGNIATTGFVNGDSEESLTHLTFSGSAQGAISNGSYTIIPSAQNTLGYKMDFVPGVLTINSSAITPPLTQLEQMIKETKSQQINTVITLAGVMNQNQAMSSNNQEETLAANDVDASPNKKPLGQCQ